MAARSSYAMSKTIYDIAREAGVGVSTVSRALNGSGYVSEETLAKIEKACVGYSKMPAKKKRGLQKKTQITIGIIVSHDPEYFFVNNTYINAMIGISAVAKEQGLRIMLEIGNQTERTLSLFEDNLVDGVILMGIRQNNSLVAALLERKYPFVLIGDYLENSKPFCKIDIDDYEMAKEAVQYLLDMGHRHIGYLGGSPEYASCQSRLSGYRAALQEAGITPNEKDYVFCERITEEKVINLAKKLLYVPNRVTAILAFNDVIANSVYKVARELGIRIPEGLSVIGFDDSEIARSLSPGLTTVQQPSFEKGYEAASRLLKQIEIPDTPVPGLTLQSILVFRGSCAPPPAFLQDNS